MKLLKINSGSGEFLAADNSYSPIDKINKDDLIRLVGLILEGDDVELEAFDEKLVKNQAHQIIYKSIEDRLRSLRERRQGFKDESARLFLDDYEKYRDNGTS